MKTNDDLIPYMLSAASGGMPEHTFAQEADEVAAVVLAVEGYPDSYPKNLKITLSEETEEHVSIFHSGTRVEEKELYSTGGRVLNCVGKGSTLASAIKAAYSAAESVQFQVNTIVKI